MNIITDIIEQLNDDSFPSIHLIDGKWGAGKSYFIKKQLIQSLERHFNTEVFYFSLYGISNIEELKDKIISLAISNNEDTSKISSVGAKIIDGIGNVFDKKGTGAIVNGIGSIIKQSIYARLSNFILIVDDLERVTDTLLISNILGECLNIAEEKNIKIIIAANLEACDNENLKPAFEKTVSSRTNFKYTKKEITNIFHNQHPNIISTELLVEFEEIITKINATNLRAIKRAIYKFNRINKDIQGLTNIRKKESAELVLDQVIRVCYAIYEKQYSVDDILNISSTRTSRLMNIKKSIEDITPAQSAKVKDIDRIFTSIYSVSRELANFCNSGEYDFSDLVNELHLPKIDSPLVYMLNTDNIHKLSYTEFECGVNELQQYLITDNSVDINNWFLYADTYLFLVEKQYIESPHRLDLKN